MPALATAPNYHPAAPTVRVPAAPPCSRADWLRIRVAHMLACPHTMVELLEEIHEAGGAAAGEVAAAWRDIYTEPVGSHAHIRAEASLAMLLEAQAMTRACGEWLRQDGEEVAP